jgi:hypothetical protein
MIGVSGEARSRGSFDPGLGAPMREYTNAGTPLVVHTNC